MKPEAEYIQETLAAYRDKLAEIPVTWARSKKNLEKDIDGILERAGVLPEVQKVRDRIEATQKSLQSQADKLQGQIQALESIYDKYHLAPLPEGVTHMYGIDLTKLDPQTRLKVMAGQQDPSWAETIEVLGGEVPPVEAPPVEAKPARRGARAR